MKKLLLLLLLVIMLPTACLAGVSPVIRSDHRSFDPLRGIYELRGNVFVQIPAHDTMLTITGDTTSVYLYSMEVHAVGNIGLVYDDLQFSCDQTDVYHADSTAYVDGDINFTDGVVTITSDSASFCWKTKEAIFKGNVVVNSQAVKGEAHYDVLKKEFLQDLVYKKNKRR